MFGVRRRQPPLLMMMIVVLRESLSQAALTKEKAKAPAFALHKD
jgi:hypothetical protein